MRLSISDDGAASDGTPGSTPGNGLRGLTERLAAVGGTLEAGPWQKGFRLLATLPAKLPAGSPADAQGRGGNGSGAPITA